MRKKILSTIGIVMAGALMLTACGGGSSSSGSYVSNGKYSSDSATTTTTEGGLYDYEEYGDYAAEDYYEGDSGSFGTSTSSVADKVDDSASVSDKNKVDQNRKLIKTVNIDAETKEYDELITVLEDQIDNFGGYVESMNSWNGSRYDYYGNYSDSSSRNSSYTIRVPRENLDAFLESFSALCNIKSKNEGVEDITLSYVDLESHKKALQTEESRLLELMEQATEMYDILTIEDKLADIRYQIQSMESQLRTYDNKVTYSTVYLTIQEVKELTIVEPEPETFWDRLSRKFVDSMESMGDGFQSFIIWFIAALPHLILWGGICFGIAMIVRAIVRYNIKKAKKRREEEAKNAPAQPTVQPVYYPYGYAYAQTVAPQQTQAQQTAQAQQAAKTQPQQANSSAQTAQTQSVQAQNQQPQAPAKVDDNKAENKKAEDKKPENK